MEEVRKVTEELENFDAMKSMRYVGSDSLEVKH